MKVVAAQKMEAALAAWSDELDKFLDAPFKLERLYGCTTATAPVPTY